MALDLIAPAKLNLTLEVLGRRADAYHDIASVICTIDLADHIRVEAAPALDVSMTGHAAPDLPPEGNLAYQAAKALAAEAGCEGLGARILIEKRVPAGAGLGGGSSDAAAVIRALNRLWRLDLAPDALTLVAASVGSDVPFFLHGGAALVTGRGERVEPLPDVSMALTLFLPNVAIEDKTRRMYAALTPVDLSDGRHALAAAESLRRGLPVAETDLVNAFDRPVREAVPSVARAMSLCRAAAVPVHVAGAGTAFFTTTPLHRLPAALLHDLESSCAVRTFACRTLSRAESLSFTKASQAC